MYFVQRTRKQIRSFETSLNVSNSRPNNLQSTSNFVLNSVHFCGLMYCCSPFANESRYRLVVFGLIFVNGEQQNTVKNFTYFNFLNTICAIHFTRQMIQFYVSHCCKHNLHITSLETNDLI